jgi:hypothetical protein
VDKLGWCTRNYGQSEERGEPMSSGSEYGRLPSLEERMRAARRRPPEEPERKSSSDEQPEVDDEGAIGVRTDFDPDEPIGEADDEAVSAVVRKPNRTAGDLSEAAGTSAGTTLEELLRRVQRIEEHLGIADN